MKFLSSICAAAVLALVPAASSAAVYHLVYTSIPDSVTGQTSVDAFLTTTPDIYNNGLDVVGITGTRNGEAITDGLGDFDEIYPGSTPFVDNEGVSFSVGARNFSFVSLGSSTGYREFEHLPTGLDIGHVIADTSVSLTLVPGTPAAPEPSQWALMIAGVGLAGAALRRSRQDRGTAAA